MASTGTYAAIGAAFAAVLVLATRGGGGVVGDVEIPPTNKTKGPSGKTASAETWRQRQVALAFVAGMKVCNCHPGNIDGLYGPATINAIIAFQMCAGIDVDGKWGTKTEAAMKRSLAEIAKSAVKEIIQPPPTVPSLP